MRVEALKRDLVRHVSDLIDLMLIGVTINKREVQKQMRYVTNLLIITFSIFCPAFKIRLQFDSVKKNHIGQLLKTKKLVSFNYYFKN